MCRCSCPCADRRCFYGLFWSKATLSMGLDGTCHWLSTAGQDHSLGFLPSCGCRMGSAAAYILWSDFLDGPEWVPLSVAHEVKISFPMLAAEWDPGPAQLIVWGSNQAKVCTEFPDQVRPLVLLCRRGSQVPLNIGCWMGSSHPCVLRLGLLGRRGWRLYSAMSGAIN